MCGIFGFILKDNYHDDKEIFINKFKSSLYLRGPDSFKYKSINETVIGISRLSIVDITHETQPFFLENHEITAVFNGEIYNYKNLRKLLLSKGIKLKTSSEIEVITNLYGIYKEKFVDYLEGMFAIAIYEHKKSCFKLFRDPYGIKPLYWTFQNGSFAFSSNLTSLINCFGNSDLDINAIQEYLFHGYCSSNSCIALNFNKLPPSCCLQFYDNIVLIKKYKSFIDKEYKSNFDFSTSNIESLLKDSVSEQISNEVPMGIMLSGGVDSSLIAKYLSSDNLRPSNIKSYSVRFLDKLNSQDYSYAEELAHTLNLNHSTININSEDSILQLEKASINLDEPIADTGIIGTNIICEKAKSDGVKVLLSGTGADELFAGYFRHFYPQNFSSQFFSELPKIIRTPISKLISILKPSVGKRLYDPLTNYFLSTSAMPIDLLELIIKEPIRRKPFFSKYEKFMPENFSLYLDQKYYLPDSLLAYTDKISMSNSIEVRVPYLSKSLSPNLFKYLKQRARLIHTKPLIRGISKIYFQDEFFKRKKEGFDASIHHWPSSTIKKLLHYISDYSDKFLEIGLDIRPLQNEQIFCSTGYYKNLIFSLYILNKWLVNQKIF